ncbi:peptidoglycan editing factor PgeF [Desulfobacterium sp. N47]|uniref:peptidoglycan editing factor PgeF n=1 Tax=Desulfobacterium sp. N47 TaxID=3115210 RepID=UPI003C95BC4C
MILTETNRVSYYRLPNLEPFPNLIHGIFTRNGGFSKGSFDSLNVSLSVGDDLKNVMRNRKVVSGCMNNGELVFTKQVHDRHVIIVSERAADSALSETNLTGDALITDINNKMLVIKTADCQAVLLYDPVKNVVANVHSGWRGSINNIIGATIDAMKENYNCNPFYMLAGISPSLGPCCAEFINYKKEIPGQFWKYKDSDFNFDFWALSADQLSGAGVMPGNIYSCNVCTKCNKDLFYSYRGEKTTGRLATVIGLK